MATGEIVRVAIGHSVWAGLVLMVAVLFAQSRPGRELGHVIAVEIRRRYWRYLKWKGVPDAELQRLLRDGWNDDDPTSEPTGQRNDPKSEPPATV